MIRFLDVAFFRVLGNQTFEGGKLLCPLTGQLGRKNQLGRNIPPLFWPANGIFDTKKTCLENPWNTPQASPCLTLKSLLTVKENRADGYFPWHKCIKYLVLNPLLTACILNLSSGLYHSFKNLWYLSVHESIGYHMFPIRAIG